ncbi:TonB-dependent receptor [Nitrospirillum viridazoti]|uniref:TonB-dependent receptor n=1 Tax=Nitrospirillum viridazoti CBAmc TaxID=1441467 RepID=A0A248JVP5_9PROT|nr:TonB-dependent receptor [Nitrospirillum amazonense]ASG22294.1 TonB-dependent receptor [Nitrospirillum amazonense CBAmc]TWB43183.1 outer membrane receptor protein involved in Fe transport [Nitrospirillum amazonense]
MTGLKNRLVLECGTAIPNERKTFMSLRVLLLACSVLSTPIGVVYAQEQATKQNDGSDGLNIAEIVVSARRKDEKALDVPASITAYSSDYLKTQNIQNFTDYATRIPNLTFQYGQGADLLWSGSRQTTIRGVAGSGTTSYYINDTPVPSSVSPLTLDLDRIEVLKGPQGTLFGASSMGGNVRFITRKPSLTENSGEVQVQGGGTEGGGLDYDGNVVANVVLAPGRLGLDVAIADTRDSGFITRRFPDASGNLVSRDGQGRNDTYAASVTLRAKLTDEVEATISAMGQSSDLHGFPAAYVPYPDYKPLSYTVDRAQDVQEYSRDRWGIGSFVLNYTGDDFSVASSTSYFARRINEREDDTEGSNLYLTQATGIDFGNTPIYQDTHHTETRLTHESRVSFDDGTLLPHLSGIAGVFYQHQNRRDTVPVTPIPALADAGFNPSYLAANGTFIHSNDAALFGELYYEIIPKLTVTAGLRQYWTNQKTDANEDQGFVFLPAGSSYVPAIGNSESGLIPKAVVSYKLDEQGNIYASVSKGFRAGGAQQSLPADLCSADLAHLGLNGDALRQYRSDTLWSYEAGIKSRLAEGRLSASAAVFQIDWSDIQQSVYLPTCTLSVTTNAGKARIRGGEMEVSGRPFAGVPFTIELGLGYTDGVLLDPGVLPQPANSPLSQVPQWSGTISGFYQVDLSQDYQLFIAADYSYTGSVDVPTGRGGFVVRQAFNMVNGNIGVSFGQSQVLFYVKNLLDERLNFGDQPAAGFERQMLLADGTYERYPRGVVSRPRQFGVQFQQSF